MADDDYRILLRGWWPRDRIHVRQVASTLRLPAEVAAAVDAHWAAAASRPGVHLFDGPLCRLEMADMHDGMLRLDVSPTSYRPFLGTNVRDPSLGDRHGAAALANPIGTSAALRTSDGFLLFGRRSQRVVLYPGRAHPFGGCLDPAGSTDPIGDVLRELREEAGIAAGDVREAACIGLAEDRSFRQPELVFAIAVALDRAEVERRIDIDEHTGTWAVPATPLGMAEAGRTADLTPVTRAVLDLARVWIRGS